MLSKQLPLVVALVIALLAIAGITLQVYPLYTDALSSSAGTGSLNQNKPAALQAPQKPQHDLASFQVFGRYNPDPEPKAEALDNLPTTKLRLTLTGVSANVNQNLGSALIEDPKRDTERYGTGDDLPGGAKLHEVYYDRIILNRGGRLETLFFPETAGGPQLLTSINTQPDHRDSPAIPNVIGNVPLIKDGMMPNGDGVPNISPVQKSSIRDRLSALRTRLKQQ